MIKKLIIHFARYGPYHDARLRAAHEMLTPLGWEVIGLETAGTDATYAWDETTGTSCGLRVITVFPARVHEEITAKECRSVLHPLLDSLNPAAIAIAGWASVDALSCLSWCRKHDRCRIVMSETRGADGKRVWWKELIKRYLISRFDGALVGGKSHGDYLVKLGMTKDKIHFGYNVVDNAYFAGEAAKWTRQNTGSRHVDDPNIQYPISNIHSPYFLASNRFIERKNLARLIDAYSSYVQQSTTNNQPSTIWNLCLLGDGELKPALIAQRKALRLTVQETAPWENPSSFNIQHSTSNIVYFPGFRQIEELPRFYAHAGCFVHPALEEPWGLVINEAMACGLPIVSSRNVGAAEELIELGVNGWSFDAENVEDLVVCLGRVTAMDDNERRHFGTASVRILEERCPTAAFGRGMVEALR